MTGCNLCGKSIANCECVSPDGLSLNTLEVCAAAVKAADARREFAYNASVDVMLRAIIDGEDVDAIMHAIGWPEDPEPGEESAYWGPFPWSPHRRPSRRQSFADHLSQELRKRIVGDTR